MPAVYPPAAMEPAHVLLPITLLRAKGAYTARLQLGSARQPIDLILDTGSSSLVVLPQAYDPERDDSRSATSLAQQVNYGGGGWIGPVLQSDLRLDNATPAHHLAGVQLALVEAESANLQGADGILGLAYQALDKAHDLQALLQERGTRPALSWPWPFSAEETAGTLAATLRQQPVRELTPAFTALEQHGVVADKFALSVRRALLHVGASADAAARDPLNHGLLVLGAGEEIGALYHPPVQSLRVLHDRYYNVELLALQVGTGEPIPAPPLQPQYEAGYASNAIVDTGSSFVVLEASLYQALLQALAAIDARFPTLIAQFQQAMAGQHGIPSADIDLAAWPELHFILRAEDGGEARLSLRPEHYWQANALVAGESWFLLMDQLPHWPNQSILGLPLLCGHYVVFDRRAGEAGVVRFARLRSPAA